jgi:hypothetical protein
MGQWEVLIPEHHPGYLCWEQYLKNQRLRDSANNNSPITCAGVSLGNGTESHG